MAESVTKLIERMLDRENELSPLSCTFKGIHDRDEEWDDPGPEGVAAYDAFLGEFIAAVDKALIRATGEEGVDLRLARAHLANGDIYARRLREHERNPLGVPNSIVNGLFIMLVREYAPLPERLGAIRARLAKVPAYCAAAKKVMTRPVGRFTALAEEMAGQAGAFLTQVIPSAAGGDARLAETLKFAGEKAAAAIADYVAYVKGLPQEEKFGCGRAVFDAFLDEYHLLDFDAVSLKGFGEEQLARVEAAMAALAAKIKPGATAAEIITENKKDHPAADGVLKYYKDWMDRARDFVREKNLCGVPAGEVLEVIETPAFERPFIPFAAYMPPAPYEKLQKGFFYVTPVDAGMTPEQVEEKLRGHSGDKVPVVALHEAYPGHHLQLCWANRQAKRIRRESDSNPLIEGWALYCEEMMREQGFYDDPRILLGQLRDMQWRAVRVIVDASLHAFGMPFEKAVDMLITRVGMERVNAEAEVKRYIYTPTQPMSYLVGKTSIMALRKAFFRKWPKATVRSFHDKLLACGSLPVSLVWEKVMW